MAKNKWTAIGCYAILLQLILYNLEWVYVLLECVPFILHQYLIL